MEKKYKEALLKARAAKQNTESAVTIGILEEIFPELRESEDERIRKMLIEFFGKGAENNGSTNGISDKDILSWLEKQGEPTEINPSEFDLRLNKLLKQFESLPKEELISNLSYYLNVIQNDGTYKIEKKGEQKHSIDINKMVDDYANNKEPGNEIFGRPVPCMIRAYRQGLNDSIGKVVLKPAWSEEDEVKINRIVACLENLNVADNDILLKDVEWLKSLKQRMGG